MRLIIVAVGRARDAPIAELVGRYRKRCGWPIDIMEVQPRAKVDPAKQVDVEADLLLGAVPPDAHVVALDERGRNLGSMELANRLQCWQDEGVRDVAFLIGGADGLAQSARNRADLVLALGTLTWPHELVRVLVAEQIYRAWTIVQGHPYHRG